MLNASHLITSVTGVRLYKTPASQSIVREDMYTAPRIWEQLKVCAGGGKGCGGVFGEGCVGGRWVYRSN